MKNDNGFQKYGLCIGVQMGGITYTSKHRYFDGKLHHSAGICGPCLELRRKEKISRLLTANGLEAELEKEWSKK